MRYVKNDKFTQSLYTIGPSSKKHLYSSMPADFLKIVTKILCQTCSLHLSMSLDNIFSSFIYPNIPAIDGRQDGAGCVDHQLEH